MIFESLLIHFSDFSRFSGSPSANFRKNREIGRIQTPLRILGEYPWNRWVKVGSGRFTDFWGFSKAPHRQISGKIREIDRIQLQVRMLKTRWNVLPTRWKQCWKHVENMLKTCWKMLKNIENCWNNAFFAMIVPRRLGTRKSNVSRGVSEQCAPQGLSKIFLKLE